MIQLIFFNTAQWMATMSKRKMLNKSRMSITRISRSWVNVAWNNPTMDKLFVHSAAGFELQCMPDLQQYVYMYVERKNCMEVYPKRYTHNIWKQQVGEENAYKTIGIVIHDEGSNTMNFQITLSLIPWEKTLALMMIEMAWATWLWVGEEQIFANWIKTLIN